MRLFASNIFILSLLLILLPGCGNDKATKASLAYTAEATTGEGAIWHPERRTLFWVDIEGCKLYEYSPELDVCHQWKFDRMVSSVVPESDSTVIVALQNEIIRLDLHTNLRVPVAPIPDDGGKLRCNDGKCDPSGRFWIGTMGFDAAKGVASLYCVSPGGSVEKKLDGVTISNGIVWSQDKQYMYYNDTPTRQIARFKYDDSTGNIVFDGIAVDVPPETGSPDGMTIDEDGNLWVAQWGGSGVYCYDPRTGKLLERIDVPAPNVASCAFGGPDLEYLYITTARAGLTDEQLAGYPLSGSLFVCKPGVKGVKTNYFGKKN